MINTVPLHSINRLVMRSHKSRLLLLSADMFPKPLLQTVLDPVQDTLRDKLPQLDNDICHHQTCGQLL